MTPVVIDTNVLAVADRRHPDVSNTCVGACIKALENATKEHCIVIDSEYRILNEYKDNISNTGQKTAGVAFLKWLYQNMSTPGRCDQVELTQDGDDTQFSEFPLHDGLRTVVDRGDRKFIATANAHPAKPEIWQAADSKWLDWQDNLKTFGLSIKFLCPHDIAKFRNSKAKKK